MLFLLLYCSSRAMPEITRKADGKIPTSSDGPRKENEKLLKSKIHF